MKPMSNVLIEPSYLMESYERCSLHFSQLVNAVTGAIEDGRGRRRRRGMRG